MSQKNTFESLMKLKSFKERYNKMSKLEQEKIKKSLLDEDKKANQYLH